MQDALELLLQTTSLRKMHTSLGDSSVMKILRVMMLSHFYSCCKVGFVRGSSFCLRDGTLGWAFCLHLEGFWCFRCPLSWHWKFSIHSEWVRWSQLSWHFYVRSILFCLIPRRIVIKSNLDSKEYNKPFRKEMTVIKRESLSKLHLKWKVWLAQLAPRQNAADEAMTKEYLLSPHHLRVSVFPLLLAMK